MARGRGICHVKHSVDCTKKIQQQIFHRIQTQQHNGTFANNMIALRNNGSIMRFNSANLIGCPGLGTLNTGANNMNAVNSVKTTVTNISTPNNNANNTNNIINTNATTMPNANANANASPTAAGAKVAFKKPVHFVNSIATSTNGPIVLLNPASTGTATAAGGNPRYAIFRRPMNQSIQLIARPTIDPSNSYSVMPVIHRVRTRGLKPNLPKMLETDRLIESLKSIIRPQKSFDTTKQVLSVYQSLVKAANQQNHHLNTSTNSSSSSKRKSHSSLSNHKSGSNHSSQGLSASLHKPNGHSHGSSNGGIVTSANYIGSHVSVNNTNHIDKRTHIRIDANHK